MEQKFDFQDFKEIVARLRSEDGCPWDRAQTLGSLKPCLIDETAEVVAAINIYEQGKGSENLCEELGDLLLQVVLQSQIAQEEGIFTLDDVICGISQKMLRRHPHVFGTGYRDAQGELVRDWSEIKKIEKSSRSSEELELQKKEVRDAEQEVIRYLAQKDNSGIL